MNGNLVWMDLEMSGLNLDSCVILEVATLITDDNLNIVAEAPTMVIHHDDEVLESMDEWNTEHHTASGLVDAVRTSLICIEEAEAVILSLVSQHTQRGKAPLCGNTIYQDRKFVAKYMPSFDAYLHYRVIDVSTLKELARRWFPKVYDQKPRKYQTHRALDDVKASIEELKYYRDTMFKRLS